MLGGTTDGGRGLSAEVRRRLRRRSPVGAAASGSRCCSSAGGLVTRAHHDAARILHRRPGRAGHDREQSALHLQGDLRRYRPQLALPVGAGRGAVQAPPSTSQSTLVLTTALILTGLAVAFAFRCGLFNIGGQGQYMVGAITGVWVGSSLPGLPGVVHIVLALVLGALRRSTTRWDSRDPEGDRRRPRGHRHDHAQLDRLLVRDVPLRARGPAPEHGAGRRVEPRIERHRPVRPPARVLGESGAPGAPRGSLHRDRCPRRRTG